MFRLLAFLVLVISSVNTSFAGQKSSSESVSFFAGIFSESSFPGDANIPFGGNIESNYNFGAIYHRDFLELGSGFFVGGEIGGALRFGEGEPFSGEVFGGATIRHQGVDLGPVNIAPRLTFGLSAVTNTIGVETERANAAGTDGTLLFYLGPEISLGFKQLPKTEFFYRTHHRSGLLKTLENMTGGHNAHVFGVRQNF